MKLVTPRLRVRVEARREVSGRHSARCVRKWWIPWVWEAGG